MIVKMFLKMVTKHINRNKLKIKESVSGAYFSTIKRNTKIPELFGSHMLLLNIIKSKR